MTRWTTALRLGSGEPDGHDMLALAVRDWRREPQQTAFTGLLSENVQYTWPRADGRQRKTEEWEGSISDEAPVRFTSIAPADSRLIAQLIGRRDDLQRGSGHPGDLPRIP